MLFLFNLAHTSPCPPSPAPKQQQQGHPPRVLFFPLLSCPSSARRILCLLRSGYKPDLYRFLHRIITMSSWAVARPCPRCWPWLCLCVVVTSVAKTLAFLAKLVALAFAVLLAARGMGRGCGCIRPGGDWPRLRIIEGRNNRTEGSGTNYTIVILKLNNYHSKQI